MATNTLNIPELLRRAKLYNPGGIPQAQAQPQPPEVAPVEQPQSLALQDVLRAPAAQQTPIQGPEPPQQPSPRDAALSSYRQAMQEQAPSQADYHPSIGRRILGSLIGGASAFDPNFVSKNPMSQLGHDYVYGSQDKKISDYQKRLAQKKEAYETEDKAAESEAKLGEQTEQKKAEAARAGAEEARRKREEWQVSPPGQEAKLAQIKAAHPGVSPKESKLYNVTLKNGESATVTRDASGQLMLGDTPLGDNAYDASTLREIGTTLPKDPKEEAAKNANEYNDFATGMRTKNPNITSDEIARNWTQFKAQTNAQYEKPPQTLMIDPSGMAQRITPGSHVAQGSTSASGLSSENVDTAPTRQMQETAPKVIDLVDRTTQLIDQQVKSLGPAASRWSEFMAGKIGEPNPEFTKLRTNAALLQTLLLRMHIGSRGGQQIMAHFKDLMDTGKQSPENLKASLEEIKAYAQDVEKSTKRGASGDSKSTETVKPLSAEELRKKYGY